MLPRHNVAPIAALLAALAAASCDGCVGVDPPGTPEVPCGYLAAAQQTLQPADPCKSGFLVAGPYIWARTTGKPNEYHEAFNLSHPSRLCLRVTDLHGPHGQVASARVTIDGSEVLGPSHFNQHVTEISVSYPPAPNAFPRGSHSIDGRISSNPGASLRVEVTAVRVLSEAESSAVLELGALQQEACRQLNEQLSYQDPAIGNQALEAAIQAGLVPGQMAVRLNAHGVPRLLDPLPTEQYGQLQSDDPESVARKWLIHHKNLLGWTQPEVEILHDSTKPSARGPFHVRFRQRISGLPVDNGRLRLVVRAGQVQSYAGHFVPDPPANLSPTISSAQASNIAAQSPSAPPAAVQISEPILVILDAGHARDQADTRLAWRVALESGPTASQPVSTLSWVDALTGVVLDSHPLGYSEFRAAAYEYASKTVDNKCTDYTKIVFDRDADIDLGCLNQPLPQYDWCRNFVRGAGMLDTQWRLLFLRAGWSNTGLAPPPDNPTAPSIPADDKYRGILWAPCKDQSDFGAQWIPYPEGSDYNGLHMTGPHVLLRRWAVGAGIPQGGTWSADTIRHELGHALLQVELGQRTDANTPPFIRALHEHAAEFWAMACTLPECGSPFAFDPYLIPGTSSSRDHSVLECDKYHLGSWKDPLSPGACPDTCNEFVHRNYWVDSISSSTWADQYSLACILDAVAYRALEDSKTVTAHGVTSDGLGHTAAQYVFYDVFASSTTTDDVFDWEHNYRKAVADFAYKCGPTGPGGSACNSAKDEGTSGMNAYWGVGFWSQPANLTAMFPIIRSHIDPAAVALKPSGIFLFFVSPPGTKDGSGNQIGGHLFMARYLTPGGPSIYPPVGELVDLSVAVPQLADTLNASGISAAANPSTGTVSLAYVTNNSVKLAHYSQATKAWTKEDVPGLEVVASDKPSIVYLSNQWLIAARAAPPEPIRLVAQNGATSDPSTCPWPASSYSAPRKPFLVPGNFGSLLLFEDMSPTSKYPNYRDVKARRIIVPLGFGKIQCKAGQYLQQLSSLQQFPLEAAKDHLINVVATQETDGTGGPTAILFPPAAPRLQVFVPSLLNYGGVPFGQPDLRQLSLGIPADDPSTEVFRPGSETRMVKVVESATPGAAGVPLVWEAFSGPHLYLFRRGGPGSQDSTAIFYSFKKSD